MYNSGTNFYKGKYRLEKSLGQGGFSEVWMALDTDSRKQVAIKIFLKQDEKGIELCRQEFLKMQSLQHPHILYPLFFSHHEGAPFIVMPYYKMGTAMDNMGKLEERSIAKLIYQMAGALEYIHGLNEPILHNDIKPDNMLVEAEDLYVLTDFGISKQLQARLSQTIKKERQTVSMEEEEANLGWAPMPYRAPELFSREPEKKKPVKATDVWALGASVYQLITGHTPFYEQGGMFQLITHTKNPTVKSDDIIATLPDGYSKELDRWLKKCLSFETWSRPSANQIKDAAKLYLHTGIWPEVPANAEEKVKLPFRWSSLVQDTRIRVAALSLFLIGVTAYGVNEYVVARYNKNILSVMTEPKEVPRPTVNWNGPPNVVKTALNPKAIEPKSKLTLAIEHDVYLMPGVEAYLKSTDPNTPFPPELDYTNATVNGKTMGSEEFKRFLMENLGKFAEVTIKDRDFDFQQKDGKNDRFVLSYLELSITFRKE